MPAVAVGRVAPAWATSCHSQTATPIAPGTCTATGGLNGCGYTPPNPQPGSATSQWETFTWPDGAARQTFVMWSDSQSSTTRKVVTTTFSFPVTAGKPYTVTFHLMTQQGYVLTGGSCTTENSDLAISGSSGAISSWSTDRSGPGPNYLIPGDACTDRGWRDAAATRRTDIVTYQATPTSTGVETITLTFRMNCATAGNNDDWWVAPCVTQCS